jgi:Tol biopolymer transport system component
LKEKMTRHIHLWAALCIAATCLAACHPTTPSQAVPSPSTPTGEAPASTEVPAPTPEPSATPEPAELLPHSLYYLAPDANQKTQVWMIERDGTTVRQITSETEGVGTYDISPVGKRLAYTTNDGLYIAAANGTAPSKVISIPADDGTGRWKYKNQVTNLLWSPDGKTLAYAQYGVKFFEPETNTFTQSFTNSMVYVEGNAVPEKLYSPAAWSPDGKKLAVNLDYLESGVRMIYDPSTKETTQLVRSDGNSPCCNPSWSPDGSKLYLTGIPYGTSTSDLWVYDAVSGVGTSLIAGTGADGSSNYVDFLSMVTDQKMVFFSAGTAMDTPENTPLSMVSADMSAPMQQQSLRSDKFFVYESLWAEDGSLAVIVQPAPGEQTSPFHGPVLLLNAADTPAHALAADGRLLRWGP